MEPRARTLDGLIHLSYNLKHRVHVARVYPVRSPNKSTIIVYGHEGGLSILWRGGLPIKPKVETEGPALSNADRAGATSDEPMLIDSDDEDPPTRVQTPFDDKVEFEEEEESDPSYPYEPFIHATHLPLDSQVLHLSFLPLPSYFQQRNLGSLPTLLLERLVVAVICSDGSVRVLTIPLLPPPERNRSGVAIGIHALGGSAGAGTYGEQLVNLSSNGHRNYPKGVSMTLSGHSPARASNADESGADNIVWDLLVASHSNDMSGLLLIHRVSILPNGDLDMEGSDYIEPWRKQILASPAKAISFNTSLYPAIRHCQLLVAEIKGPVRIYHCQPEADRGLWLLSLHSTVYASSGSIHRRRNLLTAHWVLSGKAVAVLMSDGEWGIWDVEDAGPKPAKVTDGWQTLSGISLNSFSVAGWVGNPSTAKEASKSSKAPEMKSQLAPMTPATRLARQETLFAGSTGRASGSVRGGIATCPYFNNLSNRKDDETLLLWYSNTITIIPSLLAYWQNKVKGSGILFGNGARGQLQKLNTVRLGGQLWNDVDLIPSIPKATETAKQDVQSSILITGEHRMVIVAPPLAELPNPPVNTKSRTEMRSTTGNQTMLDCGELDIDGIDSVLTAMSNAHEMNGLYGKHQEMQTNHSII